MYPIWKKEDFVVADPTALHAPGPPINFSPRGSESQKNAVFGEMCYGLFPKHKESLPDLNFPPPFDGKLRFGPRSNSNPIWSNWQGTFSGVVNIDGNQKIHWKSIEINENQ